MPEGCLPEVRGSIALTAAVALATILCAQFEADIQPTVVTCAAIVAASLWPHVLLLMQIFSIELRRCSVFDLKYGFLCWHIYCPFFCASLLTPSSLNQIDGLISRYTTQNGLYVLEL